MWWMKWECEQGYGHQDQFEGKIPAGPVVLKMRCPAHQAQVKTILIGPRTVPGKRKR